MTKTAQSLLDDALTLAPNDRAELVARLLESLKPSRDEQVHAAWLAEIDRRIALVDSGEAEYGSWLELRDRLRARLNASS